MNATTPDLIKGVLWHQKKCLDFFGNMSSTRRPMLLYFDINFARNTWQRTGVAATTWCVRNTFPKHPCFRRDSEDDEELQARIIP